ncbi:hypothetical protein AX769_04120 [Frondihabitans sp. PAMC 28766]|uniref:DUF6049 family protein n=1 Tax=Frondihabitans sp. PAMC 28766 TaxID=1795630 RepID=UPI00078ED220|nr:DUF6049 family protein [Frondihabitans sp. PAMC 28766]AMM19478.1 hypothetical protein AX769_04120 [Frondihabitans sp. PAMC 28766]
MRSLSAFAVASLAALALAVGLPGTEATAATTPVASSVNATPASTATAPGTTASGTPATPVSTSTSSSAVTMSLAPGDNGIVKSNGALTATITVHNGTSQALEAGVATVYLDKATFSSRSQIESWFARPANDTTDALGSYLTSVEVPAIPAGTTASPISITLPPDTLGLTGSDWGAKAFGARYAVNDTPLTEQHSSVVYFPGVSFAPTKLAVAVPITVPASTTGLISSEALANYTSTDGVLTQELDAVRGREVALGIDPMILASIRILGNDAPPSAIVWLQRLESAPNETFALAYADADISALRQAGEVTLPGPIDFAAQIAAQQARDPQVYESNLAPATPGQTAAPTKTATKPTAPATKTATPAPTATTIPPTSSVPTTQSLLAFDYTLKGVAWPLDNTVGSDDLAAFAKSGDTTTILSSANVKVSGGDGANAATTIGSTKAIVSDADLSGLLRDSASANTEEEFSADMAELSAELATLAHERPSNAVTLFATLDRNWATTEPRLTEALTALSKLTWSKSIHLTDAAAASPAPGSLVSRTAADSRVDALMPLVKSDMALDQFATALATPTLVTAKFRLQTLALSSTAWAGNPSGLATEIGKAGSAVATTTTQVSVVQGSTINILGDRSSLPLYVQNDTASAATVYLRVVPSNYSLTVEKNNLPVTIQPKSQQRITVPVQSVANGKVTLTLSLSSRQGIAISTPSQVMINVQAGWETVITLVFGIAVVLLFGGGIYRSVRRRRGKTGGGDGDGEPTSVEADA